LKTGDVMVFAKEKTAVGICEIWIVAFFDISQRIMSAERCALASLAIIHQRAFQICMH
jgi:hypothetical protein